MPHWTKRLTRSVTRIACCALVATGSTMVWGQADSSIPNPAGRAPRPTGGASLVGNPVAPPRTASNSNQPGLQQGTQLAPRTPGAQDYQLSPELDQLLTRWEEASVKIQRLNGNFQSYTYDEVFVTETRAIGRFFYEAPDRGRMDFAPADLKSLPKDPKTGESINPYKKAPNGTPYTVKSKEQETWNCSGSEILQVYTEKKAYNRVAIPQQFQGASIKESPLPFLFGLRKAEAKERYMLSLGRLHNQVLKGQKVPSLHIVALPLREQDAREWVKAEVLLDSTTFLPQTIRMFDPAGTSESVYVFQNVEMNSRWLLQSDPFTLKLAGFQLIENREAAPPTGPQTGERTMNRTTERR